MIDDPTIFLNPVEFADTATLNGRTIVGIVDPGYDDPTLAGMGIAGSSPRITVASADVPAHPEGMELVITSGHAAGTYKIRGAWPDATGMTNLQLLSHIS